ncbi:MAG: acetylornithine transaminase [Deltaproteobacteria bacterium]|nr:acetylornithine transaminase [Deltaproteobacteria bacterium]
MDPTQIMEACQQHIANTYGRQPVVLTRGEGCRVWDAAGRSYLDFVAGIAVVGLGHCHPKVTAAITAQAQRLVHTSNLYYTEPQVELAALLTRHSFADRVFFCNSGAEANEAAIKLARKWAKAHRGPDCYEIITMEHSFHGRTLATVTATGQAKYQQGFEPLMPGFRYAPFNDLRALEAALAPQTCAIMVEPIQGEGGVNVPAPDYLKGVRGLCDRRGLLLILDEVQTGLGRTGRLFAHEHFGITPDIMTLAKSIANGLPLGAMLATDAAASAFTPGSHASTFGGNPVACAAGVVVLKQLLEEGLLEHSRKMGEYFLGRLQELRGRHSLVRDVRGKGLMLGLELEVEAKTVVARALERGFLVNNCTDHVLRFVPPLVVTEAEVDALVAALDAIFLDLPRPVPTPAGPARA